jgi:hypothetical protein
MYDIQYELFSQNRMVHFGLWAVCATQAAFFFLTHMNHFGSIYQQDQIIRWGVAEGIIPAEVNDPNDTALVPISSGLAIRPSMANDVKLARAGLTYMALKAGYTLGHLNWDSYALLWANFVEDITAGNADLGEPPYSAPPPSRLDTASGPFASSTGPTPSSPAGPASSASAVACPSAMAPEPLPLRPWRLTVEDVLLNAPDDTDMKALEKDLLEQWLIVHGDKRQGWEPVRYLARKLSPEEFAHRQRHAAQPRKAASPKGAA